MKQAWFAKFLELPNGIPSHDTFGRVFAMLDTTEFYACLQKWLATLNQTLADRVRRLRQQRQPLAGLDARRAGQGPVCHADSPGPAGDVPRGRGGQLRQRQAAAEEARRRRACHFGEWRARRAWRPRSTSAPGAVIGPDGKRRKTHVLRIVLSHSRRGYSEVVYRQSTDEFIHCIENAFEHFGGVPRTLVVDNLKAAVLQADWFDPEINPKFADFCRHYGTVVLPTKPRTPRHKGKTERGIAYVQDNPLKGRKFPSLAARVAHPWAKVFGAMAQAFLPAPKAIAPWRRIHGAMQAKERACGPGIARRVAPQQSPTPVHRTAQR